MNNEQDIKAIAAFVQAQKAFGSALKTSVNPHFKSRYADLSSCVEAVIGSLNSNGFGLVQMMHDNEGGVAVETILLHESGGKITGGILRIPASKQDAQGFGSALTYCRRYSLLATCGIAPEEDDDGNAASRSTQTAQRPAENPVKATTIIAGNWNGVTIKSITEKSGEKSGKKWTVYFINLEDGRSCGTFDATAAERANAMLGTKCDFVTKAGKKDGSFELVGFDEADEIPMN
tara:strand:+ start:536 stop:1234 length:699 start_codon:yes stop_codon:yes gene_type:complete